MTLARLRPTASLPTAMAFAARRRPASTKEAIRPLTRSPLSAPLLSRRLHLQGLALAPVVFGGLFVALWTWKCFMMVIFQNKIIYMPGLPPNARWESIKDYSRRCAGISWREERLRAADGTDLALCLADIDLGRRSTTILPDRTSSLGSEDRSPPRGLPPPIPVYILYFQGNASSTPPRLPDLSSALRMLQRKMQQDDLAVRCTMVCLSYRGYWSSKGRPTETGIRLDAAAALQWIHDRESQPSEAETPPAQVILWGQSIGAGVATNLAAERAVPTGLRLNSLILETPFTSLRAMLHVLYPQRWLPYQYLWPFLRNQLDSWGNIEAIVKKHGSASELPRVLILQAAKDELVPAQLTQDLYDRCSQLDLPTDKRIISGAFHNDVMFMGDGRRAVSEFIADRIRTTA